jgi:hypothetical protein
MYVKFFMVIDNKHTYKFCMKYWYMVMMHIFEVTFGKLNMVGIFVTRNYAQKWFSELYYH